jgi:molybdopterin molybdotransferase
VTEAPRGQALSVEAAQSHLLNAVTPTAAEQLPVSDALAFTLAADVTAPIDLPPFDTSSVDGYAVIADDTAAATPSAPVSLAIIDEAPAGTPCPTSVVRGTAIRVLTGALAPSGATSIVPFENTDESERDRSRATIQIYSPVKPGDGIRVTGSFIRAGSVALRRGRVLRPSQLGTLSSLGLTSVAVHRRPRIALLTVGDQFAPPGGDLAEAKIFEANEAALASAVQQAGGVAIRHGIAADRVDAIAERVATASSTADIVVLSGGVAHGAYDIVKDFLLERGRLVFWRVAMRPGRPCGFGWFADRPIISLAGNPGAALVGFEQFVRPVIRKMLGRDSLFRQEIDVVVQGQVKNVDGRQLYLPARVELDGGSSVATLLFGRGAPAAGEALEPNALVIVPANCSEIRDGDSARAQLLFWDD